MRDALVSWLQEELCPAQDVEGILGIDFADIVPNVTVSFERIGDFFQENLAEVDVALKDVRSIFQDVEEAADVITISSWQSLIFIIPFSIFFVLFFAGVLLAWFDQSRKRYTCLLSWFVLPLFFFLVIVCYILSSGIAIGASANAGMCHVWSFGLRSKLETLSVE